MFFHQAIYYAHDGSLPAAGIYPTREMNSIEDSRPQRLNFTWHTATDCVNTPVCGGKFTIIKSILPVLQMGTFQLPHE
ncbi:hypothetical protein AcW2_006799 [Taiwanofungus camphoratus]|nr:hypothetical protein AcW2_006799 [Antrodia cinnamomea]